MSNIREYVFDGSTSTSPKQQILISGSPTGKESIKMYGTLGVAGVLELQSQAVLRDGTTSAIETFATGGTYSGKFEIEINIGKNENIYVNVTGADATTNLIVTAGVIK